MNQTSISLLDRVCRDPDSESWQRLVAIYTPALRAWLSRYDLQASDADDLVQEVLIVVSREVAQFEHNGRQGAFRNWLRTILVHRLRNFWRSSGRQPTTPGGTGFLQELDQLADPGSEVSRLFDRQHDDHVLRKILDQSLSRFTESTWLAFRRIAFEGQKAAEVAAELGISVNAVLVAKSRVLSHLKQEARGLID